MKLFSTRIIIAILVLCALNCFASTEKDKVKSEIKQFREAIQKSLPEHWSKVRLIKHHSVARKGIHFSSHNPYEIIDGPGGERHPGIYIYLRPQAEDNRNKEFAISLKEQDSISKTIGKTKHYTIWVGGAGSSDKKLYKKLLTSIKDADK